MGTRPLFASISATLLMFVGCATTSMPIELTNAQVAYAKASEGPAAQVAPDELHKAKTSLDAALKLYNEDPQGQTTRDMAYVAERKAELAEARAQIILAQQEQAKADEDYRTTLTEQNQAAKGEIERQKAQTAEAQAQASENAAAANQAQAQADAEARARQDAEARANAAMSDLAKIAQMREEERGMVITLSGDVLFQTDQSTLLSSAAPRLDQLADALAKTNQHLLIEGYTDSRGSAAHNQDLSMRRAAAVRDYLVNRGIDSSRFDVQGFGKDSPVADNSSAEGRAMNRRVEIVIQGMNTARR